MKSAKLVRSRSGVEYVKIECEMQNINKNDFIPLGYEIINFVKLGKVMRAIVFNFTNFDVDYPCFEYKAPGDGYNLQFKAVFANTYGWKNNDKIRVMFLNEIEPKTFRGLLGYFEKRLNDYEYLLETDPGQIPYLTYSDNWTAIPGNPPVDDICDRGLSPIPRQTGNDDILMIRP